MALRRARLGSENRTGRTTAIRGFFLLEAEKPFSRLQYTTMYLDFFERHLAIGSREEALRLTKTDKHFWHVISICSPITAPLDLSNAKSVHRLRFEDTENAKDTDAVCVPRIEVIADALAFADKTAPGGLLVHCQMGWSRSTAIALVLLARKLYPAPDGIPRAIDTLLLLREKSRPNILIVQLGLSLFMNPDESAAAMKIIHADPHFSANRLATSSNTHRNPYI